MENGELFKCFYSNKKRVFFVTLYTGDIGFFGNLYHLSFIINNFELSIIVLYLFVTERLFKNEK